MLFTEVPYVLQSAYNDGWNTTCSQYEIFKALAVSTSVTCNFTSQQHLPELSMPSELQHEKRLQLSHWGTMCQWKMSVQCINWTYITATGMPVPKLVVHVTSFLTVLHEDEVFPITGKANVRVRESIVFYLVVQDTICLTLSQRRLFHLHFPDNCGLVGEVTKFSTKSVIEESISFSSELPPHCRTTTD